MLSTKRLLNVKMLTHVKVLALDEGKAEARRDRGRTCQSVWIHEILWARKHLGKYHHLVQELKLDGAWFKEYFRMSRTQFEVLLRKIRPSISRKDTNYREAFSLEERLSICLR